MKDSELTARLIEMEPILRSIARGYLRRREDQQDAVQECMAKAWQARKGLRSAEAFKGWIVRIMKNECANACRRAEPCLALSEETTACAYDPIKRMLDLDALYGALSLLPPQSRELIRGRYFESRTLRELADAHGLSMGTVQSRIYRSLRRLAPIVA